MKELVSAGPILLIIVLMLMALFAFSVLISSRKMRLNEEEDN